MYRWMMASFGTIELHTVNHDPTFYSVLRFLYFSSSVEPLCRVDLLPRPSQLRPPALQLSIDGDDGSTHSASMVVEYAGVGEPF